MLTVRINSNRSSRSSVPISLLLRTYVCLLVLLGPLAPSSVEGQPPQSPCPNVFVYRFDPDFTQTYGYVEIHDPPIGSVINLKVSLSVGTSIPQKHSARIQLVKSNEETLTDINNYKLAKYFVVFPYNTIPNVLSISVNGYTVCTGQKATGWIVTTINLAHTFYPNLNYNLPVLPYQPAQTPQQQDNYARNGNGVQTVQPEVVQTQRPPQNANEENEDDDEEEEEDSSEKCGQPAKVFNRLSIKGIRSPKGQFPWAAPIFDNSVQPNPKYICGSTIITTQHLITAAHCMYDSHGVRRQADDVIVVPGMYNIDNFFDADLQERNVLNITIHDDYYFEETGLMDSDIAVIKVDYPIVFNDLVQPICPWKESNNLEQIVGMKGFVSGWGITENGNAKYPSYVTATVVDQRSCSRNLEKTIAGSARLFCADGHGSVPCNGDSGSGLVIKRGQKYYLRGIVSFGQLDLNTLLCKVDKYVVYTDFALFRHWISKVIKS